MRESVRIMRFAIVGTLNALITALIVGLLMHIEGEHYMIAYVESYVVAKIHRFIWCKYWIFPFEADRKKNTIWHEILFFSCAFAVAYGAQFLFLLFLVEICGCNEYLAQFLGLFVYGGINFMSNKWITFR